MIRFYQSSRWDGISYRSASVNTLPGTVVQNKTLSLSRRYYLRNNPFHVKTDRVSADVPSGERFAGGAASSPE